MTQREEFEWFFVNEFGNEFTVSKHTMLLYSEKTDQYMNGFTNDAYKTWKVAKVQAVPEGWKLVPEKPTGKMLDAAFDAKHSFKANDLGSTYVNIYKLMVAAAPDKDVE